MGKYLEGLENYRRQLENMHVIADADMASTILTGVEGTHRNVVRMFNRDEDPPDLEQVLSTLRSEAEMDEAQEEQNGFSKKKKEEGGKMIGSIKGKKPWQGKKKNIVGPGKKVQGGGAWKETCECHYCHKVCHLQAICKKRIADQKQKKKDDQSDYDDDSEAGVQPKKGNSKKKKSRKIGFTGRWTKASGTIGMMKCSSAAEASPRILACSSSEFNQEWMLDTGTDAHVCTSAESFQHELHDDDKYFNDWTGDSARAEGIDLVQIRTMNALDSDGAGSMLTLEETRFSPNGPTNLLSPELLLTK